jgi:hypothetical protein
MSPGKRLVESSKAVCALLQDAADPKCGVTVERCYVNEWLDVAQWINNPDQQTQFTGRRVYVMPGNVVESIQTRGSDYQDCTLAAVVIEQYHGPAPAVPTEWVDERVIWVSEKVYDRLNDARLGVEVDGLEGTPISAEPMTMDQVLLYKAKIFMTVVPLTLQFEDDV